MRPTGKIYASAVSAFFVLGLSCTIASADFVKSDDDLYVDWLDLAVDEASLPPPLPLTEYGAFAIVETGGENLPVTYVIFSSFKGKRAVHGAFRCDKEFEVQTTHTNGLFDIRCVKQNVFGEKTATILQYNGRGLYEEHN